MPYRLLASALTHRPLLAACSDATSDDDYAATHSAQEVQLTPDGNTMQYAQAEVSVGAGATETLTFENTATSSIMVHNGVMLTTNDDDRPRVAQASLRVGGDHDYLPDDEAIHAATPLAQAGARGALPLRPHKRPAPIPTAAYARGMPA